MFKITGWAIFILLIILACTQCGPKRANRAKHDFASSDNFKKLSREEQVKKCGSCHKEIYDNEMLGPHAHAYTNLQAHLAFVNSKEYDCPAYKDFANNFNGTCYNCHTSKNLYETVFTMQDGDYDFNLNLLGKKKSTAKRDATQAVTGVDCITCHFDGEGVITQADFKPSAKATNCPGYCNPVASKFFSGNDNCQPCHSEQFYNVRLYNRLNKLNLSCGGCHDEKDEAGKHTHYTYWAHNPVGKRRPDNLDMFNTIEANYVPEKNAVKITWFNKYLPHTVSVCTELVACFEIRDGDKTVKTDTIRLNRRTKHMSETSLVMNIKNFPGVTGYEFKGLNDSLVKLIPVPALPAGGHYTISLTGIKKEQYWLNDSINTVYFRKDLPL